MHRGNSKSRQISSGDSSQLANRKITNDTPTNQPRHCVNVISLSTIAICSSKCKKMGGLDKNPNINGYRWPKMTKKRIILLLSSIMAIVFFFHSNAESFTSSDSKQLNINHKKLPPKISERFYYTDGLFTITGDDNPTKYPFSSEDLEKILGASFSDRLEMFFPYKKNNEPIEKNILHNHKFKDWWMLGLDIQNFIKSWKTPNKDFKHYLFDDKSMYRFVLKEYGLLFPEVLEAWDKLPRNIFKYDFFKYLMLLSLGGTYSDIDTTSARPFNDWFTYQPEVLGKDNTLGAVIGIEGECDCESWKGIFTRRVQLCQWTMQFKRGHPILRNVIMNIVNGVNRAYDKKKPDVLKLNEKEFDMKLEPGTYHETIAEITGAGMFTDTVLNYLNSLRSFEKVNPNDEEQIYSKLRHPKPKDTTHSQKLDPGHNKNIGWETLTGITKPVLINGDVLILPQSYFNAKKVDDENAYVVHNHHGSWKTNNY